jgi:hypothetical protein
MEMLASLLVAKPINILLVSLILFSAHFLLPRADPHTRYWRHPLFFAGMGWAVYSAWEWWVLVESPEADIRIDLLLIWPLIAILTAWGIFRSFRPRRG